MTPPHPKTRRNRRRGAYLVEFAIVLPVVIFMILGIVVMSYCVNTYQQLAGLARIGARYAAVHGADYARENNQARATAASVRANVVLPYSVGLDPNSLTVAVSWNDPNEAPKYPNPAFGDGRPLINIVTVTLTYQWQTSLMNIGPYTLTATSHQYMQY